MAEELIGRRWELGSLTNLLASARSGRGQGLLLLGDAGIGKTTLAEALAAQAGGCTVGLGRCPDSEAPPYWAWRQALGALGAAAPLEDSTASGRLSMFADVAELLTGATATKPALLILEDIHQADPASLALLQFLTGVLPGLACALLLTSRDNSVDLRAAAAAALEGLPSSIGRLTLRGLGRAETAVLVQRVLGRPEAQLADTVFERTQGNPFFVQELARLHAAKQGAALGPPAGVQQVIRRRLARLRQSTNDCLTAAAVLGDDVDVAVVAGVVQLPMDAVLGALDEAVGARLALLDLDCTRVRFAHALVREVLYDGLGAQRRGALHGRAGAVLAAQHAGAATVADHFRRALGFPDAAELGVEYALLAADEAMRRSGYEQALRYFRWAAERLADPGVRLGIGQAQVLAGQLLEGRRALRELAHERLAANDGDTAARAVLAMGGGPGGFEVDLQDREMAVLLERALPLLDAGSTKAAALAGIAVAHAHAGAGASARGLAEDALELASRLADAKTEAVALSAWCDTAAGPDYVAERSVRSRRMLALAEVSGDRTLSLLARRLLVVALLEQGRFGAADEQIAAYAAAAVPLHTAFYSWPVPVWRGMRALMRGEHARVDAYLAEAAELARDAESENGRLMMFSLQMGRADATGRMHEQLGLIDEVMGPFSEAPMAQCYLAYYLVKAGDHARAVGLVDQRLSDGLAAIPKDAEWLTSVALLGEAGRLLERHAAVTACAAALEPYRDLWLYDGIGAACYGRVADRLDRFSAFLGAAPSRAPAERAAGSVGELRKTGTAWSITWRGQSVTMADTKGVRDLATLLRHPRTPIHVLDLMGTAHTGDHDTGPLLDQQARSAYKARLRELSEELEEAEQRADPGRAERLHTERQFLAHELAAALGLGGRARVTGDPAERARKAVSMRIAAALTAIEHVHPPLGRHLRASIRTGRFCVYEPEDDVTWYT